MADKVVVTNVGLGIITGRIKGSASVEPKYVGWGKGTTDPAVGDTAMETPSDEARVSGTTSLVTTNTTDDTYQVVATIVSASAQTITELGSFDGAGTGTPPSGANLFLHATFTGIGVGIGDSVQFTVKTIADQAA
jgi:hypothetical protein